MRDIFREGKKVFLLSGILFLGFGVLWYFQRVSQWGIVFLILSLLMIFLFGYTIFFLRVPRRKTKIDPDLIYASADGFVMLIDEDCEAPAFLEGRVQKVLIFMHVASMHWNLSPIEGTVEYEKYQKGSLKNVMKESSWQTNEHQLIGIENKENNIKILVSMIAGLIAKGESVIDHAEIIERGYEDLETRLAALGARITKV